MKWAAASVNRDLGRLARAARPLGDRQVEALLAACREVAEGKLDDQFPVDVFQTGSGTSSNMNANEVIANRAIELAGGDRFRPEKPIHPNDHVNLGQSTNDVFPTAIHVAAAVAIRERLIPRSAAVPARCWPRRPPRGRTCSRSAAPTWPTPRRCRSARRSAGWPGSWSSRSSGPAGRLARSASCPSAARPSAPASTPIPSSAAASPRLLAQETGIPFVEAADHFEANAQRDGLVECHGQLRTIAVTLFNVANNIRWLASGPRCGFYEIKLPDRQPGSSIMPGKVNPVLCESLMQVAARVMGNDQTIAFCGAAGGQFQLNVMMPVMGRRGAGERAAAGGRDTTRSPSCAWKAWRPTRGVPGGRGEEPLAGHGAEPLHRLRAGRRAGQGGLPDRQDDPRALPREEVLPEEQLDEALDPWRMTKPGGMRGNDK